MDALLGGILAGIFVWVSILGALAFRVVSLLEQLLHAVKSANRPVRLYGASKDAE